MDEMNPAITGLGALCSVATDDVSQNANAASQEEIDGADGRLPFDDRVAAIESRISAEPRHAFTMRRLLSYCEVPRDLEDLEQTIESWPEMRAWSLSARTLLSWMVDVGAIAELEEDVATAFQTTQAGKRVVENYYESDPMGRLFAEYPDYGGGFLSVLDFCREPRTKQDIEAFFKGDPLLEEPKKIYSNFFSDKLERFGGLVWDNGWKTTPQGLELLRERGM